MPELASADGKKVMELLGHSAELSRLLETAGADVSILIGSEINNPALSSLSVIASRYIASDECSGSIAVIGPVRMNYRRIVPVLQYTAQRVGVRLGELIQTG